MQLVIHQMVKFQHVFHAHRDLAGKLFARTSVEDNRLAAFVEARTTQRIVHIRLFRPVEHRGRNRHALGHVARQLQHIGFFPIREGRLVSVIPVGQAQRLAHRGQVARAAELFQSVVDLQAQAARGPAHVGFQDLTDVHARRHAQRVQHQVNGGAIGQERHVLDGNDLGDDTLVAVTASHLVARLQLALHCDKDLDHLHHARRQVVAATDLFDLVIEPVVESAFLRLVLVVQGFHVLGIGFFAQRQLPPLAARQRAQQVVINGRPGADALGPLHGNLAGDQRLEARIDVTLQDRQFVVPVTGQTFDFFALDLQRALVLVHAVAVEDAHLNDGAISPGRQAQRGIAHVRCLFAEDGAQKLFFRRHRAFALGGNLAHKDVARLHFGTDIDDPGFVEVAQGFLADVRDVARDLFRPQLRVARGNFVFLDMDRGEDVVAQDALRDQDRVFVVVPIPRHEGDDDVAAKGQFAHVGAGTVGHHFATCHGIAHLHQRALVDAGRLVGPLELAQTVDIDARLARVQHFRGAHHDTGRIHLVDHTRAAGHDGRARVARNHGFDARAHERRVRLQQRHRLTLHVRPHQGAVGVVVLKERDQRGRDRDKLLRRHVDQVNRVGRVQHEFSGLPAGDQVIRETPFGVLCRVGLRHGMAHFLGRRHIDHLVGDLAVDDLAVRGFDEAVLVHPGIGGKRVDQADVLAFGRLDRAHPAIMGRVHVAHLEPRAFAGQTARPKGRQTALVRDFGQRVGLVHELRQLRRAEEFAHRRRCRLCVDQVLRHDRVDFD